MASPDSSAESGWLNVFKGRRVLVTGHTGFKGSWMAIWLNRLGADVQGFSLEPVQQSLFSAAGVADMTTSLYGDVRNPDDVSEAFSSAQPEVVFHLAAQSLVRRGYENPIETYGTNVMGTANVLEAARHSQSVRGVVVVTSDKCYENRETTRSYRKTDALGGRDPYSSSKGCAELVTSAYRRSFFNDSVGPFVASARAGNVIGGGDWSEDRLVPDIARSMQKREPVVIRNPGHVRPWQHVLEPLRGYLMLGGALLEGRGQFAQEWNFGPGDDAAVSVQTLTQWIVEAWGGGSVIVAPDSDAPHEASVLKLDTTKAQRFLRYQPLIGIHMMIEMAVSWYKGYQASPHRARELTETQIDEYTARIE
ncbi:MAG: CDP-glucose 4,6-dehydratase [Acidimicrobiia bacterium]